MNNKIASGRIATIFSVSWLVILIIMAFSLFFDFFGVGYMGLAVMVILSALLSLLYAIGGFCYVEVEVENSSLCIKYYNLIPLGRKYKMYRIPVKNLIDIKEKKYIISSFLHIYEKSKKGTAKYPAIGISAMSNSQRKQLIAYLKTLLVK